MPIIKAISPIPGASSLPEPGSASHTPQVKSQLRNPDVRPTELGSPSFGAIKSTCNENTSKAPSFFNGHPRIKPTSVTHNTDVAALAVSTSSRVPYYTYPSYYYPTADWLQPVTTGDLTETRETHNFVVHDIIWDEANEESYVPATSQRRTKPSVRGRNFHIPWAEHMSTLFGDHVDWNAVLTLPHKARIIGESISYPRSNYIQTIVQAEVLRVAQLLVALHFTEILLPISPSQVQKHTIPYAGCLNKNSLGVKQWAAILAEKSCSFILFYCHPVAMLYIGSDSPTSS
jgi:hypothetical protein